MNEDKLGRLDPRLLALIRQVRAKRPRTVIEHIVEHGLITTQDLKDTYGYNHPPRAARDVRECGIPLRTFKVAGTDGRRIAAYEFGDLDAIENHKADGRRTFSKELKQLLFQAQSGRCAVCNEQYADRYLQVDHRVPYEVVGDGGADDSPDGFMLVCGACNRAKSWSCEHCENWTGVKDRDLCEACYWGRPNDYEHIAAVPERRVELVFSGDEVGEYEKLRRRANTEGTTLPRLVMRILRKS